MSRAVRLRIDRLMEPVPADQPDGWQASQCYVCVGSLAKLEQANEVRLVPVLAGS